MKRRTLCVVCLVLYILISCTLFSLKIEDEMLTQVEILNVRKSAAWGQSVSIPQTALFKDEKGRHLYEVIEGSGWESGLRVREISSNDYDLDMESGAVRLPGGRDYFLITTASRQPIEGELVEIVEANKEEPVSDRLLFVYPDGVPAELETSADMQVLEKTAQAILVQTEREDAPFFEHKQKAQCPSMAGKNWRIYSVNTLENFWKQLPLIVLIVGLLLCIVLLWFFFSFICRLTECFGKMLLFTGMASLIAFALEYAIISFIDLPAAVLPDTNILHISHYVCELRTIYIGLESLPNYGYGILQSHTGSITKCVILLAGSLILTAAFIAGRQFSYKKRRKILP